MKTCASATPASRRWRGVSLAIARGEIFALLGPNGAGKTTWISLDLRVGPSQRRPRARPGSRRGEAIPIAARKLVGLVPQEMNFDPFFTPREVLGFQMGYFGQRPDPARIEEVLAALDLSAKGDTNTRALSGGMKRRLLIGKALVHRPPVVFLDEPTAGVDVALRRDLWSYVRQLRQAGTTIVLTTHYLEEAEALADRVAVIDHGKLICARHAGGLAGALRAQAGARHAGRAARRRARLVRPARAARLAAGAGRDPGRRPGASSPARSGSSRRPRCWRGWPRCDPPILDIDTAQAVAGAGLPAADRRRSRRALVMNPIGFRTLLKKEMRRFLRVPGQTLAQPVVTTTLYFLVFGYALGGRVREVDGVPYVRFIVPGLMLLGLSQNAFLNTSSSMFIAKLQGTIVDLLVAPLSVADLLLAFTLAAVVRGLMVGGIVWAISALFTGFEVATRSGCWSSARWSRRPSAWSAWWWRSGATSSSSSTSFRPSSSRRSRSWAASSTARSMLPKPWSYVCRVNPVLYMVEGLRYGVVGSSTSSPWLGLAVTAGDRAPLAGAGDLDARDRLQAAQLRSLRAFDPAGYGRSQVEMTCWLLGSICFMEELQLLTQSSLLAWRKHAWPL